MLNIPEFKDAKLVRLDDWYVHEINKKSKADFEYWIIPRILMRRNNFYQAPKEQLTSDHKDMDLAKILFMIEVHFEGRTPT